MAFVDDMRSRCHAVESTCRILRGQRCRVAARTYRCWRRANRPVAARTLGDAQLIDALLAVRGTPEGLDGRRKMTHYLRRRGHDVAFCAVAHQTHTTEPLWPDVLMPPSSAEPSHMSQAAGLSGLDEKSQYRTRSVTLCGCS
jgi:hypothetical protein